MAPAHKKQKLSNGSAVVQADAIVPQNGTITANKLSAETIEASTQQANRSLFVRSLPVTTTSQSLTELFSESYPIKHATAVLDKETKLCRGFGFVTFADAEDAVRAKEEFNGFVLEGKKLRVEIAEKRNRENKDETAVEASTLTDAVAPSATAPKSRAGREPEVQQSRLIVRNLPWTIKSSDDLAKLFLSYGKVKQAYIPKKGPGLLAGFGFVVLRGRKNAEKALEGVNGKEVDGRTLAVDWAITKEVYEHAIKEEIEQDKAAKINGDVKDAGIDEDSAVAIEDEDEGVMLEGASDYDDEELDKLEDDEDDEDDQNGQDQDENEDGMEDENSELRHRSEDRSLTLFIRNLPFTCDDEALEEFFTHFGPVRYARVVMDHGTERSKGTGFVCFYNKDDADSCLKAAPRRSIASLADDVKGKPKLAPNSILQNEESDPSGKYTMDGRVMQIARAVDRNEADRLTEEGRTFRSKRDKDKRRLYLLSEGTISSNSKLWEQLPPSERTMRDASAKQRKQLIESNPSLHLSLTRLSIRNIPRTVTSKDLKALAREAVVGFAKDVKEGKRQRLSPEELSRGGDDMVEAEKARKLAGTGIVKQAKVVFEAQSGSKVSEDSGAGRSRGYGFVEYHTHRSALMGLRWLNGHAIGYQVQDNSKDKLTKDDIQDRKKRLIVEFAIENAQVVLRRKDREVKARERSKTTTDVEAADEGRRNGRSGVRRLQNGRDSGRNGEKRTGRSDDKSYKADDRKRKRSSTDGAVQPDTESSKKPVDEKLARRNQIIGRKRAIRKARKGAK